MQASPTRFAPHSLAFRCETVLVACIFGRCFMMGLTFTDVKRFLPVVVEYRRLEPLVE